MTHAATRDDIARWLLNADDTRHRWVVIAHDGFSDEDFPVFVNKEFDIHSVMRDIRANGDRIHEVYNLNLELAEQLDSPNAWNL